MFNNKLDQLEERISESEDRVFETNKKKKQNNKRKGYGVHRTLSSVSVFTLGESQKEKAEKNIKKAI